MVLVARAAAGIKPIVRFLRTRRGAGVSFSRDHVEKTEDSLFQSPVEEEVVRHPKTITKRDNINADHNETQHADLQFEIRELKQKKDKTPECSKVILGKHVAEEIRAKKKPIVRTGDTTGIKQRDLGKLGEVGLAKILRKHVIFADQNLVIVNKPYGVAAHGGDNIEVSLDSCLPILSKMVFGLNTSIPLTLCNRLDKCTTGITVCAANKDMAKEIMKSLREQRARRKYWAVTVGTPVPRQGLIDIPLAERYIEGERNVRPHRRMCLAPERKLDYSTGDMVRVQQRRPNIAVTSYKVLDSSDTISLVEFQPFTTVKHQIRVHAAEGLSCCILGDHKHSQPDKLLPQRLPKDVLSQFRIKPTRSRDMPMHLHLREILIPGILENSSKPNLLISAKTSEHMYRTMKLFKLKPGAETDFQYPARLDSDGRKAARNSPRMEELYDDPFGEEAERERSNEMQRDDCYTVYKPKVFVKFQYHGNS